MTQARNADPQESRGYLSSEFLQIRITSTSTGRREQRTRVREQIIVAAFITEATARNDADEGDPVPITL